MPVMMRSIVLAPGLVRAAAGEESAGEKNDERDEFDLHSGERTRLACCGGRPRAPVILTMAFGEAPKAARAGACAPRNTDHANQTDNSANRCGLSWRGWMAPGFLPLSRWNDLTITGPRCYSATNTVRRCLYRTAMDTLWNIGFAILVLITWFRARWLNERK
jgi:hypothetical protein